MKLVNACSSLYQYVKHSLYFSCLVVIMLVSSPFILLRMQCLSPLSTLLSLMFSLVVCFIFLNFMLFLETVYLQT